jgi:hypothetical protein
LSLFVIVLESIQLLLYRIGIVATYRLICLMRNIIYISFSAETPSGQRASDA